MCDIPLAMMTLTEFIESRPDRPQREWAEEFGVSRSFFSEILSGRKFPGRKTISRIEEVTGGKVPASVWFPSSAPVSPEVSP